MEQFLEDCAPEFPVYQGKYRESFDSEGSSALFTQNHDMISDRWDEIPCVKEQGIFLDDQGMVRAYQGK
jgi:hypothetical protein